MWKIREKIAVIKNDSNIFVKDICKQLNIMTENVKFINKDRYESKDDGIFIVIELAVGNNNLIAEKYYTNLQLAQLAISELGIAPIIEFNYVTLEFDCGDITIYNQ